MSPNLVGKRALSQFEKGSLIRRNDMLIRVITYIGTLASIVALTYSVHRPEVSLSGRQGVMIGLAVAGFLILILWDIRNYLRLGRRSFKTDEEIRKYMHNWISRGGRVVIFTRDMSWAGEGDIKDLLLRKSRRNELCLCLPRRTPLAEELAREGATIYAYEQLNYVPQSRFTIINKDRMDAHVAVGRRIKDKHVVEEFCVGDHPVFAVANDLIEIIQRAVSDHPADRGDS